ncbi:hypothetical protein H0H81_011977 [Sphagnurus paluster]|uniref:Uncharacterized protein n=1 Tax=Sphagnurus paluster TaxID=117069 RepID=A0A9P7GUE0_9AGAR|nr:hypothetical protein H0H81_011977 [Sphagnurus paluster]
MEFLPPEDVPKGPEAENYLFTRVRLAWYYRPGDVSDRSVADSRLLLAAIFSEVCDINQLRAKCHVVHRDKISDLSGWKKRPDRFYFNRLFDPYVKKEFEIIPSADVRNLPDNIRETLTSRYEYVVAEKEVIPDLTDAIRLCDSCQDWCPTQHTVAEDTLDPDDLIFPRTATRHGPKFQANVAPAPELDIAPSHPDERGGDDTIENLGIINTLTESESQFFFRFVILRNLTHIPLQLLKSSVDWLTEVIRRFSEAALAAKPLTSVNMRSNMRLEKWKKYETPFTDREWTRDEIAAFEDAIVAHGAELRAVREEVATRSMPEVVRFYGLWKSIKVGEENLRLSQEGPPPKVVHRQYTSAEHASDGQHVGLSDDEGSIIEQPSKSPSCAACRTRESVTWWKAPKGLATNIMCDSCGTGWRKYADLVVRPVRDEAIVAGKSRTEKREGTPLAGPATKRARTSASAQSTPPPAVVSVPQLRCLACMKNGPIGKVLKCKTCHIRVHAGQHRIASLTITR